MSTITYINKKKRNKIEIRIKEKYNKRKAWNKRKQNK